MVNNFIFIEDGSLDAENLNKLMKNSENAKVKFITYKQGAAKPELVSIESSEATQQNPDVYKKEGEKETLKRLYDFLLNSFNVSQYYFDDYDAVTIQNSRRCKTSYNGSIDNFMMEFETYLDKI